MDAAVDAQVEGAGSGHANPTPTPDPGQVDAAVDAQWKASDKDKRGAIVAQCAHGGNAVCAKAVSIFTQCYGSEVGMAALRWLPV